MWRGFRGMIVAGLSLIVMLTLSIGLRPAPEDLPSRSGLRGIGDVRRIPDGLPSDRVYFDPVPYIPVPFTPFPARQPPHRDGREILVVPSSP